MMVSSKQRVSTETHTHKKKTAFVSFFSHFEFYITSFSCFLILLFEERGNVTRNTVTTTNDEIQSKAVERRL
jgi:hypothetical protein